MATVPQCTRPGGGDALIGVINGFLRPAWPSLNVEDQPLQLLANTWNSNATQTDSQRLASGWIPISGITDHFPAMDIATRLPHVCIDHRGVASGF
ncbi:MAG: hypothetical protein K0U84_22495 [Actinomycetia bacterium]|nr:hypothetical protein [Actinomycetes bacterium]